MPQLKPQRAGKAECERQKQRTEYPTMLNVWQRHKADAQL